MYDLIFSQKGKDDFYKIWHTPEKNVFMFIESGEGDIFLREKSYPIAQGVLCFIGKNRYHYTSPVNSENYVRSKLFIDSETLQKVVNIACDFSELFNEQTTMFSMLSKKDCERVLDIFNTLNDLPANSKYMQAEICSAALSLIIILAKNANTQTKTETDLFHTAIKFINSNISQEITIDKVAEACFVSKYYLCHMFKKTLGLTIMEYILQTRIVMAKELLKEGNLPATQVSILCGFSSPSYFSRVFKQQTGMSPSKYKKQ